MKIPLNAQSDTELTGRKAQDNVLERDIMSCKRGDWTSKNQLVRAFMPLIRNLAERRAHGDTAAFNQAVERGKEGLMMAVRKFNPCNGAQHFRVFAVDYIEKAMDNPKPETWLKRLFHRSA